MYEYHEVFEIESLADLIPIVRDLQARVLNLENLVKAKDQRCLDLEEEMKKLRETNNTAANQAIKANVMKKSYAATAVATAAAKPSSDVENNAVPSSKRPPSSQANRVSKKSVAKKLSEEPWTVVRGRGIRGPNCNIDKHMSPLLIPGKANVAVKKDFCISGLPAGITEETLKTTLWNVLAKSSRKEGAGIDEYLDEEGFFARMRFVKVHKRQEDDTRSWTWARIGVDSFIEDWLSQADRWPMNIRIRPWKFKEKTSP